MRRGGGSRGSRRSGGGRTRSRMSSSSRRHYHGRHRGRYYGGGYYSRYGRFNPFAFLIVMGVIGLVIIIAIAGAIGGGGSRNDNLAPGEMALIDTNGYVSASLEGSTIVSYFYDSRPATTGTIDYTFLDSIVVPDESYEYWEDYYLKGSVIELSWSAAFTIDLFVIFGASDFSDWKEGDATQRYQESGAIGTYLINLNQDARIYFAFENTSFNSNSLSVTFDVEAPVFNTLLAKETVVGSFSDKDIDYSYVVIENTGASYVEYSITLDKQIGFWPIFLVLLVLYIVLLRWIGKKITGGSRKVNSQLSSRSPTAHSTGYGQQPRANSVNQQHFNQPSAQPNYVQRPTPKYCGNCGTSMLKDTRFCSSCGQRAI